MSLVTLVLEKTYGKDWKERLARSAGAGLVGYIPVLLGLIPAPYNLLVTPVLMALGKGIRDAFPNSKAAKYFPV